MKKYSILSLLPLLLLITFFSPFVFAEIQKGKWDLTKDEEYCFIQSIPIKTLIPEGKSRGDNYILIYKMHKNPELIIQISAGFNYKSSNSIQVEIDKVPYNFYTDSDTAWAKDDKQVIYAMKRGLDLVTTGTSSKGTEVVDVYTLKGFTSAINILLKEC